MPPDFLTPDLKKKKKEFFAEKMIRKKNTKKLHSK